MTGTDHPRTVRSFVTRAGRLTPAQARALEELWPRFGVAFADQPLQAPVLFGREAPRIIEIGFGNGAHLLASAAARPEHDFLGIEVHRPGVGRVLLALAQANLGNVRLICHDAVEVLQRQVPADWAAQILLLFPDPWPKKRHHKRRLVQQPFVELAASRLAPGGELRLATDWAPYAQQMLEVLEGCGRLRNLAPEGGFMPRPSERAPTRFEARGARLGHGVWDLAFGRR